MEGSPVRGQKRAPDTIRLNEAGDLLEFQSVLGQLIREEMQESDVFVALIDTADKQLRIPSWVRQYIDRYPHLTKKLEQGELVFVSHTEAAAMPRPTEAVRSNILLIPLLCRTGLRAVAGIISPADIPQAPQENLEAVRHLCFEGAPVLARLEELASLREENRKLLAMMRMRSHLQCNVAHELRTPLAAVRGYARMILDGRAGEINKTQKDYLTIVIDNSNRLINLVGWMSHVADQAVLYLKLSSFDLGDVWFECVNSNSAAFGEKPITIESRIPEESFSVTGDREKLAQVFHTLIALSAKFIGSEGNIVAEFSHSRERDVTVKIADNGSGVPPEFLNRVLDGRYTGSTAPVSTVDINTGSLSEVYDIVGMHGGRVFVNSKAGEGTTFLFTLPAVADGEENLGHEQAVNSGRRR